GVKFAVCAACALASSFTLSHGLLLWGLTFPLVLADARVRRRGVWLLAWIATTAACAVFYFHDYAKPVTVPDFAPAISLLDYGRYLLAFLGGEFAYAVREPHRLTLTMATGGVLLAGFLAAGLWALSRWRDAAVLRRVLPWFALGGYSIGSGALATLGRVGFGLDSALSSRYVAFSLYLTIAVFMLALLVLREIGASRALRAATLVLLGGTIVTLLFWSNERCVRFMASDNADTRLLRAGVVFGEAVDTTSALQRAGNQSPEVIRTHARALDELQLLRPRLVRSGDLLALLQAAGADGAGELETIERDEKTLSVSGFAILPAQRRPADAVLLMVGETAAMSGKVLRRSEVARRLRDKGQAWSGWSVTLPAASNANISAFAVEADVPRLHRLPVR
nr:hypothetical protein [Chthoniobacterales bacterium]